MTKFEFLINLEMCSDHRGCQIACKRQNDTPTGMRYMETYTVNNGEFPNNATCFLPMMCQHCDAPSCAAACTEGAIVKTEIGAVTITNTDACAACDKPCVAACPYDAIKINPKDGTVGKCDMCVDLLAQGKPPACVPNCQCMAMGFGDVEDPDSPYNQLLGMVDAAGIPREVALHKLSPETGNRPSTTYILASKPWLDMKTLRSSAWVEE